jgi:hypothetical protein
VFRLVEGTAEVVTEAAAGGVAGGMVDSVAEVGAEHASEGGAPERVAESATEEGAEEGGGTKPAGTVDMAMVGVGEFITGTLMGAVVRGILAGMLAGLLIEYCGGPAIDTVEAGACGAALAVGYVMGNWLPRWEGRAVLHQGILRLISWCGTQWSVVPRGVRWGSRFS